MDLIGLALALDEGILEGGGEETDFEFDEPSDDEYGYGSSLFI